MAPPNGRPFGRLQHDAVYCVACQARCILQVPMGKAKIVKHLPLRLYCLVCDRPLEIVTVPLSKEAIAKASPTPSGASDADRIVLRIEQNGGQVAAAVRQVIDAARMKGKN